MHPRLQGWVLSPFRPPFPAPQANMSCPVLYPQKWGVRRAGGRAGRAGGRAGWKKVPLEGGRAHPATHAGLCGPCALPAAHSSQASVSPWAACSAA